MSFMNINNVLIRSVSGDSDGFAANGVEACCLIYQVGFIDNYRFVSIRGNYFLFIFKVIVASTDIRSARLTSKLTFPL